MRPLQVLTMILSILSFNMGSCQSRNYEEKLESLYKHTVDLINADELNQKMVQEAPLVILDIRSYEEYKVSHIDGAKLIEYDEYQASSIEGISKDSEIVVYCSVGYRSEKIGEKLKAQGYTNVKNLYGGIFQWKNEGYTVINPNSFPTDSVHTYNKKWSKWLEQGIKVY